MKTQEREMVIWNGEAYPAPEWLAAIIREERRELVRRHEERSRRHPAEFEDGPPTEPAGLLLLQTD